MISDSLFDAASPVDRRSRGVSLVRKVVRLSIQGGRGLSHRRRRLEFYMTGRLSRLRARPHTLTEHIGALLGWLLRAQRATPDDGVSESFHFPTQQWRPSYPETTGYIICSLLRAAAENYGDASVLRDAARRMGEWLADVQMPQGAFQGGNIAIKDPQPAVFNTGQILEGLTDLCHQGLDESGRLAASARRAARWLAEMQDSDGAWRKGISSLTTESVHAYNVRAAWALARYGRQFGDDAALNAGIRNADWLLSIRQDDGWFPLMNFDVGVDPLLHTIAYTIQGLMELGVLCGRDDFVDAARHSAARVAKIQEPATGAIPGQLGLGYRPMVSWTNTTANSQMAVIWFRLAGITGEWHWLEHARRANVFNRSLHEIDSRNQGVRGAVRGSWPSHLGYGRYWYMNWTQKFFLDALLAEASSSASQRGSEL
jgi:Prenyltransferase and squalene oxidase repeat